MKTFKGLFIIMFLFLAGCFAPVNLTFDSAKTLEKGQIELQGAYSRYSFETDTLLNQNYGFTLGYGISDKYTMKFRYEFISPTISFESIFDDETFDFLNSIHYLEINSKISLVDDALSLSLPMGVYFYNMNNSLSPESSISTGLGWFSFDPRLYLTFFRKSNIFELTVIPKAHILFGSWGAAAFPGISLGFGLSSDLDRWAIRPELGFDGYLSYGIGMNYYFNFKKQVPAP